MDAGDWRSPGFVIVVLMRDGLPDSIRWHLAKGNYEQASKSATQLLERPVDLTPANSPKGETGLSLVIAFQTGIYPRTIFASVPWFLQDISTYGIGIFTPTIIGALALGTSTSFIAKDIGATEGAAVVDVLLVVGFMLAILLVRRVSRVSLQIMGFLGMAAGLLLVGAAALPGARGESRWG